MKKEINIKVNKYFKLIFSILTLIVGILFVWQTGDIYFKGKEIGDQMYTYEVIGKHFKNIAVPTIAWLLGIICGIVIHFVFPLPKEKSNSKFDYERLYRIYQNKFDVNSSEDVKALSIIKFERIRRLVSKIVLGVIILICAIMTCCFVFNFNNYSKEGNLVKEMVNIMVHILPWMIISFGFSVAYQYITEYSFKMSFEAIRNAKCEKKQSILEEKTFIGKYGVMITRIIVGCLAVIFIVLGIINKGYDDVLNKAINICTECIGLG